MSEDRPKPPSPPAEESFDRLEYMRTVRREVLAKLDLPENTKPERVLLLTRIKEEMAKIRRSSGKIH
ncbi:MAG: hypothetical protein LBT86_01330 [Deltaproteobacteria bacterium]|jgi:hypothetical protein|nr:hypothetical protein [Deltaproteobacteria bacterium]